MHGTLRGRQERSQKQAASQPRIGHKLEQLGMDAGGQGRRFHGLASGPEILIISSLSTRYIINKLIYFYFISHVCFYGRFGIAVRKLFIASIVRSEALGFRMSSSLGFCNFF